MTTNFILTVVDWLASALQLLIVARILLSWFQTAPTNPVVRFIYETADPLLKPAQRIIPPMAGLDFSPLLTLVVIQVLQNVLHSALTK